MLVPLVTRQTLTADLLRKSIDHNLGVTVFQPVNAEVNNTLVYQDSTSLRVPVDTEIRYVFWGTLFHTSAVTPAIKYRFAFPGATSVGKMATGNGVTTNSGTDFIEFSYTTNGAVERRRFSGWVSVGTTAGSLVVGFSQVTPTASATTLRLGSWLTVVRVEV